jgi:hypothetical protein
MDKPQQFLVVELCTDIRTGWRCYIVVYTTSICPLSYTTCTTLYDTLGGIRDIGDIRGIGIHLVL